MRQLIIGGHITEVSSIVQDAIYLLEYMRISVPAVEHYFDVNLTKIRN